MDEYTGEGVSPADNVKRGLVGEVATSLPRIFGGMAESTGNMLHGINAATSGIRRAAMGEGLPEDTAVKSLTTWGQDFQKKYAISEANRVAHPYAAKAADLAEGVAKMLPLMAVPGGAVITPLAMGAEQYGRSYDTARQKGMSEDDAAVKALVPAAAMGGGMALMGPVGEVAEGLIPDVALATAPLIKKALARTAADTLVMQGQGLATAEAEKQTGIRPEAQPLQETLLNPEAWATAGITAGLFQAVGAVKGMKANGKMQTTLEDPAAPIEQRAQIADYVEHSLRETDPEKADAFGTMAKDAIFSETPKPLSLNEPEAPKAEEPKHDEVKAQADEGIKTIQDSLAAKIDNPELDITQHLKGEEPNAIEEGQQPADQSIQLQGTEQGNADQGTYRNEPTAQEQGSSQEANGGNNVVEGGGDQKVKLSLPLDQQKEEYKKYLASPEREQDVLQRRIGAGEQLAPEEYARLKELKTQESQILAPEEAQRYDQLKTRIGMGEQLSNSEYAEMHDMRYKINTAQMEATKDIPLTEKNNTAAMDLSKAMSEQVGAPIGFKVVAPTRSELPDIIAKAFGKELYFVKQTEGNKVDINGAMIDTKRIFISKDAQDPYGAVVMHELLHQLKDDTPWIYSKLLQNIVPELKHVDKFRDALNESRSKSGLKALPMSTGVEELIANFMGERIYDKKFWESMAQKEPTMMQRVYEFFKDIVDRIKGAMNGRTNQYIVNLENARNAAADAMSEYSKWTQERTPQEFAQQWSPQMSSKEQLKPFYSKMEEFIGNKFPGKASGKDAESLLNAWAKKGEFSKDELAASGILDELKGKEKISKQEMMDIIKANTTDFKDVVLGGKLRPGELGTPTRYDVVRASTGEVVTNYTSKERAERAVASQPEAYRLSPVLSKENPPTQFSQYTEPGGKEGSYREMFVTAPREETTVNQDAQKRYGMDYNELTNPEKMELHNNNGTWSDGHTQYSDIQNPVVRIRFNERETDGKRILFVEEMQGPSDANQSKMPDYLQKRIYDIGVKRVLAYAKENGYDGISWTPGETQAKRYDLSKQVDNILVWSANGRYYYEAKKDGRVVGADKGEALSSEELSNHIGKDLASKAIDKLSNGERAEFSGSDLSVGGGGLKNLYDKMLPKMFAKYGKGEVGETKITEDRGYAIERVGDANYAIKKPTGEIAYQGYRSRAQAEADLKAYKDRGILTEVGAVKAPYLPISNETPSQYPKFSITPQSIAKDLKDNKFISDDVIPTVTKAVIGIKTMGEQLKNTVAPGSKTDAAFKTQNEFQEVLGKMYQKQYQAGAKLDTLMRSLNGEASTVSSVLDTIRSQGKTLADTYFARLPKEDAWDFMFRKDNNAPQEDSVRQAISDFTGEMFDSRIRAVQDLGIGIFDGLAVGPEGSEGANNPFFPRYWEKPEEAVPAIINAISKRPLDGQKTFLKSRIFGDIYEGMQAGYKLVSDNPIDLMFMKINEMDRFIAAHTMLQSLEKQGLATLHPGDEFMPPGETNILGIFGSVKKSVGVDADGLPVYKSFKYGVREDVARVINNYLSPTLYSNQNVGQAFTAYMTAASWLNQMQLGVGSMFHAGFTGLETIITHVSLGMKAVSTGDLGKAVKYFATAPAEMYNNPKRGNAILKAWATGDTTNDSIRNMPLIIEGLQLAGVRKEMDQRFQTHVTENMFNAWANGNKLGAAVRAPFAMVEQMARPIMEWLVPRQKFGVFGEMYSYWLDAHQNATHAEKQESANQIWNRVDSRLGQVNYDRLFINNTAKNLVQGALRAPGWTGGTILELGGGFKDLGQMFVDVSKGKKPVLTDRTAYGLSLIATTAVINGALTMLFTGDTPEGHDFIAFRTGNTDEHGFPERFMLPTYMKDLYAYANDTPGTLGNKLHPLIGAIKEAAQNKDYYGTEIINEGDNIAEKMGSMLGFGFKQFVPFWVRGLNKEIERGGTAFAEAAPMIGVMPAPSEMNRTPAEKAVRQFVVARTPSMTKTAVEFQRGRTIMDLTRRARNGEDVSADIQDAVGNGEISTRAAKEIINNAKMSPLAAGFRRLSLEEARKVMEKATPAEEEELAPILKAKEMRWSKLYPNGEAGTEIDK
jgi:hypothetical protein